MKKQIRSESVIVRLTPPEKQKLVTLANEHGDGTISSYIRDKCEIGSALYTDKGHL